MNKVIIIIAIAALQLCGVQKVFALETAVFRGRVFDVEGKAVKGAGIFLYNSSDTRRPADFISARTDAGGNFRMTVPAGKYQAVARERKGGKYGPLMPGDRHSGGPVEIELAAGGELLTDFTVADLRDAARLAKKTRDDYFKIEGRVLDGQGGPAARSYYVTANRKGEDPSRSSDKLPDFISAWTDRDGRYSLFLPKGKYSIGYAGMFPPQGHSVYKELNVEADKAGFDIVAGENKTDEKNNN
ncbi:MAG: carboxypeptidase regulatory-like domain-containing protein [Nitrospirae bacterium]|nr:carboxypeptidase regulatory-like domain-containing protein [Nitrospirota bacterium]